jgi:hypothetical protein
MLKPADPQPPEPRPESNDERPIGELVHQLVEEGKAYAQAELGVVKAIAAAKVTGYKVPAILLGAALLMLLGAVTLLALTLFVALQLLMAPVAAGLLGFAIFAAISAGLGWWAVDKIRGQS